jgi:hypothetical protein
MNTMVTGMGTSVIPIRGIKKKRTREFQSGGGRWLLLTPNTRQQELIGSFSVNFFVPVVTVILWVILFFIPGPPEEISVLGTDYYIAI